MLLLAIESSGLVASIAIMSDDKVIGEYTTNFKKTHSQTLLPMVESMLSLSGIDIKDIDEFALTVGPGSFTGLRIGAATVMGLAGDRPCRCVPTLTAIAYNFTDKNVIVIPALDARRNQVYTAVFRISDGKVSRLTQDEALSVDEVFDRIREYSLNESVIIAGDGAYLFENAVSVLCNVFFAEDKLLFVQGESIAKASEEFSAVSAQDIKLNYLRLSQAERELKEKMKK